MSIYFQCPVCGQEVKLLQGGLVSKHEIGDGQECKFVRKATSSGPDKIPPASPQELIRRQKKIDEAAAKKAAVKKYRGKRKQASDSTQRIINTLGLKDPPKPKNVGIGSIVNGGLPGQGIHN